eukprot:7394757-Alexandrium_andersonii.AAC.1
MGLLLAGLDRAGIAIDGCWMLHAQGTFPVSLVQEPWPSVKEFLSFHFWEAATREVCVERGSLGGLSLIHI